MGTVDQIAMEVGADGKGGSAPAITVEDLHKSFGSQKVLNGISLTVSRGETLAVLGRSGTGKRRILTRDRLASTVETSPASGSTNSAK
jgi:ABC-type transporter Mla maintaining outer membrane lipid asymmetry ATPase subunit MlaF